MASFSISLFSTQYHKRSICFSTISFFLLFSFIHSFFELNRHSLFHYTLAINNQTNKQTTATNQQKLQLSSNYNNNYTHKQLLVYSLV